MLAALLTDRVETEVATNGDAAIAACHAKDFDVVLSDIRTPGIDGVEVMRRLKRLHPDLPVVLVTDQGTIAAAVGAMKLGAFQYLTKPCDADELQHVVERASASRIRTPKVRRRLSTPPLLPTEELTGHSGAMMTLRSKIDLVARATSPVLITGETGTGKEVVARAIHTSSARRREAFVTVNTSAIPEALLESEMFGHVRGAFTGATHPHRGYFTQADGGTLLLDEIGDMPLSLQAKLLRVLQEGEIRAVGGEHVERVDVRVVAATNQPLRDLVRSGRFREDLFYRLDVIALEVPPLRARREDIPELARIFLTRARRAAPHSRAVAISDDLAALLASGAWPGNVRELESTIERLVVFATTEVLTPKELALVGSELRPSAPDAAELPEVATIDELVHRHVEATLEQTAGNKANAAKLLGVDLSTLYRWLRKWR